jgi:hypothetical protein
MTKRDFLMSAMSDEQKEPSTPRTVAFALVVLIIIAFIAGIVFSLFKNSIGTAYCKDVLSYLLGGQLLTIVIAQIKSGYVLTKQEKSTTVTTVNQADSTTRSVGEVNVDGEQHEELKKAKSKGKK